MRKEAMSGLGIVRASDFARKMFSGFPFGQGSEKKGRFAMNAKKIMAALAVTGCALAGYSDVSSSNIVGYKGETLVPDNFSMIGVPFTAVDGKGADLNNELMCTGVSGCDWADSDVCDFIHVYINGDTWYFFYYNTDNNQWQSTEDERVFSEVFEEGIPAGTTMWFEANPNAERSEPVSVTFSGAVQGADSVVMPGLAGDNFNMISNPYPVAYDINNEAAVKFTGVSGCDWADSDIADFIHVYINGDTWYFFYYNTDNNQWQSTEDERVFSEVFEDGITAGWWFEGNPNAERTVDLSIEFFSPLKKSAE